MRTADLTVRPVRSSTVHYHEKPMACCSPPLPFPKQMTTAPKNMKVTGSIDRGRPWIAAQLARQDEKVTGSPFLPIHNQQHERPDENDQAMRLSRSTVGCVLTWSMPCVLLLVVQPRSSYFLEHMSSRWVHSSTADDAHTTNTQNQSHNNSNNAEVLQRTPPPTPIR